MEVPDGINLRTQMNTAEKAYQDIVANTERVDTTREASGYPRGLKMAYTADNMQELRDLKEAAEAAGHTVEVTRLHRQDGWALWARSEGGDLNDDAYMGRSERDAVITLVNGSNPEDEAFQCLCGDRYDVADVADLLAKAKAVQALADDFPYTEDLEEGEAINVFVDLDNARVDYTVRTGQNGYSYDTHHYHTALLIKEREEEEA